MSDVTPRASAALRHAALLAPILAQASSNAIALRSGAQELDYAALVAEVRRLSAVLQADGLRQDEVIAIPAERTPETVAAVLAIIGSSAACLPLDLDYPASRIAAMLDDAQARSALIDAATLARLPSGLRGIDRATSVAAPAQLQENGELAYVLFTSGSTGRPKGVAMRRAAFAHLIEWHRAHPRLGQPARTLQFAPLGFDVSFQEIFSTLATGGTLVLPADAERRDPYALLALLARERIERLFLPYVALQALAEAVAAGGELPRSLRDVITAGEQLRITPAIRALFASLPDTRLHNHYGPTETHVVTVHELAQDSASWPELPPIGQPLPHVRACLVDAALSEIVGSGEGELLLGGDCLAAGYINRPELTAERFIEHAGARWYRSGDRVRRHADGHLDYLGRIDEQLKIDGFRIEPAEIESVLCRHVAVAEAAVVAADGAGGRQLVAHVVARDPRADRQTLAPILNAHCMAFLASYLVPQRFELHAALPLTASGKIDRRALARDADAAPLQWRTGDSLLQQVLGLWRQLLAVETLESTDNVFDSGARSLLVVRALTELRRHDHVLSVAQVYEHPSVAAQVALLEGDAPNASAVDAGAPARGQAQRAALARFGPRSGASR